MNIWRQISELRRDIYTHLHGIGLISILKGQYIINLPVVEGNGLRETTDHRQVVSKVTKVYLYDIAKFVRSDVADRLLGVDMTC